MGRIISNGIDYSGTNLITPECYSTEERVVGCWVDGKPLYQKTITLSSGVSVADSWTTIYTDALIGSIGQLVKVLYDNMDNHGTYGVMNYKPNGNNLQAVYPISGGLNVLSGAKFTLYYTKTADTAGSGVWTPSGIPAVHYSTDEQVIGTWIDGSTLYEKTYEVSCTLVAGSNEVEIDSTDFSNNTLIDFDYNYSNSNGDLIHIHNKLTDNNLFISQSNHKLIFYIECLNTSAVSTLTKIRMTVKYTKSS